MIVRFAPTKREVQVAPSADIWLAAREGPPVRPRIADIHGAGTAQTSQAVRPQPGHCCPSASAAAPSWLQGNLHATQRQLGVGRERREQIEDSAIGRLREFGRIPRRRGHGGTGDGLHCAPAIDAAAQTPAIAAGYMRLHLSGDRRDQLLRSGWFLAARLPLAGQTVEAAAEIDGKAFDLAQVVADLIGIQTGTLKTPSKCRGGRRAVGEDRSSACR